jgi:zinc protease
MEGIGATDMNGTTDADRTDYYETVPVHALDVALWIESDRMGHFLGAMDQARLDGQRGVVQNEKRQGENQPYGRAWEMITKGMAPPGHPYSWTVIGSMEDLNAASLDDVRAWFKTYYGAANAVLVLAGDINAETALRKTEQYFGAIPSGPPVARFEKWIPSVAGTRRQKLEERVPQARLYKVWNIPPYGEIENHQLELARDMIANGENSRLYKRLVYEEQIATDVSAFVEAREISGLFTMTVTARPGADLRKVEAAIDEEMRRFLADGPMEKELARVKAEKLAGFVRATERIGGYDGKANLLAMGETFRADPGYYRTMLKHFREATVKEIQNAARKWLTDDVYILEIRPRLEYGTNSTTVERVKLPTPGAPPEIQFPTLQRATLSNGLKLVLAERHTTPMVSFSLQVDAGFAADQFAIPGTARLATEMLKEGTSRRTVRQINEELALLGASISTESGLDSCSVNLSALTATLAPALELYADVLLHPSFPESEFRRLQKQRIAGIRQEKVEPLDTALRVFPALLYGREHAYANPLTGSGTETSVAKLTPADAQNFHRTWFKPDNATLIIVGDVTLEGIASKLEKLFGKWKGGSVPKKNLATVERQKTVSVYLLDRPGSIQSVILAGHVAPPKSDRDDVALEVMNTVLGNTATSRLNMNLREGKHWSYGALSVFWAARGQQPFIVYAPVQTDKTRESLLELDKELRDIRGARPITAEELKNAQAYRTLRLPGSWETISAIANSLSELVSCALKDDYFTTYPQKVRNVSLHDLANVATNALRPDSLVWVVVGDRAKIESGLRELAWSDIQFIDADGNRLDARCH